MNEDELLEALLPLLKSLQEIVAKLEAEVDEDNVDSVPVLLSKQVLLETVSHEGIVLEAYKDSKGILTWGIGVTDNSGHKVSRYINNPQTLKRVLEVYEWLVRTKYMPDVVAAFNRPLKEHELAAALSFHYNTGAIKEAAWVKSVNEGKMAKAKREIMNWRSPPDIIPRREKERDLFFNGKWSNTGKAILYTRVRKPSMTPDWSSAKEIDISKELDQWAS